MKSDFCGECVEKIMDLRAFFFKECVIKNKLKKKEF